MGTIFSTVKIPTPIGPYSLYKKVWDTYYLSGLIAIDGNTWNLIEWWISDQTTQVCKNLKAILSEIGLWLKDVIKTTVFLKNMNDYEWMNNIYKDYFLLKPARSTVEVSWLPRWALVEIECIAQKQSDNISRNDWGVWRSI